MAEEIKVFCSHSETRDTDSLIEHPHNINRHPKNQIEMLSKIIKHQGWRNPIVISKRSGFVVKGHGRLAAAKLLNCPTVPVDLQDYKDEASEVADMLADNRIAELSDTRFEDVRELILGNDFFDGFDIDLTGFDSKMFELNESNENSASGQDIPSKYAIVIETETEAKQADLYEEFQKRGLKCRIVSL